MIGGHSTKDGGYRMMPLTEQRSERLAATVRVNIDVFDAWTAAAERLTRILALIAEFGANVVFTSELRLAEAVYDDAKADAVAIMSAYLPPERS